MSDLREKRQTQWPEEPSKKYGGCWLSKSASAAGEAEEEEGEDLAILTRQLSSQMEYNNLLLEHLQGLEESHLEAQREMKKKEHALKLALSVSDAAREELEDLKKRWGSSSKALEEVNRKYQEARIEAERREKDLEAQKRQVIEARDLYEQVLKQKSSLEDRLSRTEHELEAVKNQLYREKSLDTSKIQELTLTVEGLNQDLEKLKQRHLPLSDEHKRLSQSTVHLEKAVEEAHHRLELESQGRTTAEQRIKDMERSMIKLKEGHKELNYYLKEEQAKVALLEADIVVATEAKRKAESEVASHENWLNVLKKEHKDAVEENKALKNELEHVADELLQQARQRGKEQERWAEKLTKTQQELAKVTEDARLQAQRHLLEGQRRSAEHLINQKQAEDQLVVLQKEHAELHGLLKTIQGEQREEADKFQQERESYKSEVQYLKAKLAQAEERLHKREKELLEIIEKLGNEVKAVRFEMSNRGGRYVQMLGTVQQAIRTLAKEGVACKEQIAEIATDFQIFKKCIATFTSNQTAPVEAWYQEVSQGMDALVHQNKGLRKEVEEKDGQIQEREGTVEELKTEMLKHQDDISSLRHEVMEGEDRLLKEKRGYEIQLGDAQEEMERVRREKNEAERRFRRLQESLDVSNVQNLKLQGQCQSLSKEVGELRAEQTFITKRLESDNLALQSKCRSLETIRLDLLQERESILRALEEEEKEKIALRERIKDLETTVLTQRDRLHQSEKGAQKKMQEMNHVLQQSVRQLESTQKLMGVMRQNQAEAASSILSKPTNATLLIDLIPGNNNPTGA